MAGTPDDADRESVLLTECEGPVSAGEGLVVNLLAGSRIPSAVAGVDDHVSVIGVVFVPTGEDYGFRALRLASGDTSLDRYVYPALAELGAILEEGPLRITWYVSEDPFRHAETYRLTLL